MSFMSALVLAAAIVAGAMIISRRDKFMSEALNRLTTEVAEARSASQSAKALIAGLAQQIRDAATDPAALNALADDLDSSTNELSAAVTENTPAADLANEVQPQG